MGACVFIPENLKLARDGKEMSAMDIWPTILSVPLKKCKDGAIVHIVGTQLENSIGIVSTTKDGSRGLISLGHKEATYIPFTKPDLVDLFLYDGDALLLPDLASSIITDQEVDLNVIRNKMGLLVFAHSSYYLNVHHATDGKRSKLRFDFKNKILVEAPKDDNEKGVAFRNWSLMLVNSKVPYSAPLKIFSMRFV